MNIVDRRPNPKGKSLANRQRFLDRARGQVKKAVADALKKRKVGESESGETVTIPTGGGTREPVFHNKSNGGDREYIVPGNKKFVPGDTIDRSTSGDGGGRGQASPDDGGEEDAFEFVLTKEEFLNLFFEDLELPNLEDTDVKASENTELKRAGYSVAGNPSNLNLVRTMRNSLARRISLHRPTASELASMERMRQAALAADDAESAAQEKQNLDEAERKRKRVAYIDPVDVRYNRFERVSKPNNQAVMFCLMDVSGSMTEHMKDLAKRFFVLLNIFLHRNYKHVEVVFIRHTSNAAEVDEETFFHSKETGGTIVSTALEEMIRVIRERYSPDNWNIYAAQASDGDNYAEDSDRCRDMLRNDVLPLTQYFAYLEVGAEAAKGSMTPPTDLWRTYTTMAEEHPKRFAMRKVFDQTQIFPVFHELFAKKRESA